MGKEQLAFFFTSTEPPGAPDGDHGEGRRSRRVAAALSSLVPSSLVPSSLVPSSLVPSSLVPSSLVPPSLPVAPSPSAAPFQSAAPEPAAPEPTAPEPTAPDGDRHVPRSVIEQRRRVLSNVLSQELGEAVDVSVTDNRRSMISSRHRRGLLELRLHHMFLHADPEVIRALARFLRRRGGRAEAMLDRYIADNAHRVRAPLERVQSKPAQGHHHDLDAIYRELNGGYFEEAITASIHWGRKPTRRRRRSIQLGTYVATDDLIRIHPALDQDWVPTFFVAFIVFHEMLHAAVGGPVTNGRQYFHNARFRALERSYPDYDRAIAWERKHLDRLLRWT